MSLACGVRLVASDLDGTLLNRSRVVSERTTVTLRRIATAGVTVVAATGRSHWTAVPRLQAIGVIRWAICSNGSTLFDAERGEVVERFHLDTAATEAIAALPGLLPGIGLGWEHDHGIHRDDVLLAQIERRYGRATFEEPQSMFDLAAKMTKVMVGHDELDHDEILSAIRPLLPDDLEVTASGGAFVEVTAPGVEKGWALQRLAGRLGIGATEVAAFGDQQNDLGMLRWAGRPYAMANAHPLVLAVTPWRAPHHHDDGVAAVLDELFPHQF